MNEFASAVAARLGFMVLREGVEVPDILHPYVLGSKRNMGIIRHYNEQVERDRMYGPDAVDRAVSDIHGRNNHKDSPQNDTVRH
jgi:hypothetical protein